jgi:hypothetical protein
MIVFKGNIQLSLLRGSFAGGQLVQIEATPPESEQGIAGSSAGHGLYLRCRRQHHVL